MAEQTDGGDREPVDRLMERIWEKAAGLLSVEPSELEDGEELMDQGLDSVRLVEIVTLVRKAGYEADFADLAEDSSLEAWRELLEEQV